MFDSQATQSLTNSLLTNLRYSVGAANAETIAANLLSDLSTSNSLEIENLKIGFLSLLLATTPNSTSNALCESTGQECHLDISSYSAIRIH